MRDAWRKPSVRPQSLPRLGDFTTDRRVLVLIAMAIVAGTGGALAAWVLIKLIALVTNLLWFGTLDTTPGLIAHASPSWWMVAVPIIGGLVIGLMARYGSEKIRGHGIPEAIEAILIGGSRMSAKVALLKPLSSAISIGSGGPFGAEGPIIMTGGALGSLFAQCFKMTAAERKTLLVAGAAAGMTAVFGTPAASVLLAVELLLFEWKPRSFIPVLTACVVSAAWRPALFEAGRLFPFDGALVFPWWGLLLAIVVGVIVGLQSGLMTLLLYKAEDFFEHLPIHWMWWPAIGGIAVGVGGLFEPRALGVGYDVIGDLLSSHMVVGEAALILVVKSAIWLIALASGTSGGVLAPLLILGGSAGWLMGHALPGDPALWALIGMAAMMGGTMRAPLTGVVFALELTGDINALLPLLAATGAAYAVTVLLMKRSILTEKIARRGQHISREYATDPFELLRVSDVMVTSLDTLPAGMSVDEAVGFFTSGEGRYKSYPVVEANGSVVGMASRSNILRWRTTAEGTSEDTGTSTLYDIISDTDMPIGYPDEVLGRLADRMVEKDVGRIAIVDRGSRNLVGLVARKDLLRIRTVMRTEERHRSSTFHRPWQRNAASGVDGEPPVVEA